MMRKLIPMIAVLVGSTGCFGPDVPAYKCGSAAPDECPDDQVCNVHKGQCVPKGSKLDASVDTPVDLGKETAPDKGSDLKPDAMQPDAPKPDAPKPDAPKPDAPKPDLSVDIPAPDTCANNQCGGCKPLSPVPGTPCGICGVLTCKTKETTVCVEAKDMFPLTKYCVDFFEASAWSTMSCSGSQFGVTKDDYPLGFPNNVSSKGLTGVKQTSSVFACSVKGVTPSAFLTFYQAKKACENSNKRLCTESEWVDMCRGGALFKYPYGNTYNTLWCNDKDGKYGKVAKTGQFTKCEGGYKGIFDASGNLYEITTDVKGTACKYRGGSYLHLGSQSICYGPTYGCNMGTSAVHVGFRCCRSRP